MTSPAQRGRRLTRYIKYKRIKCVWKANRGHLVKMEILFIVRNKSRVGFGYPTVGFRCYLLVCVSEVWKASEW